MDFKAYSQWSPALVKSIEPLAEKDTIEPGDMLKVGLDGRTIQTKDMVR